jgi:hypothetical protein
LAKQFQRRRCFRNQPIKQEFSVVAMFVNRSELNEQSLDDLPRMLPSKFQFIWPSGFRGEEFLEINQSETRIVCGGDVC